MTHEVSLSDECLEAQAKQILAMEPELAERVIKQLIYELVEADLVKFSSDDQEYYYESCGIRLSEI
jgi:hypothetical protein